MSALKERLETVFGRGFDYEYIRRLTGQVRNDLTVDVDRAQIEPRLAALRENCRLMREELLRIVYWKEGDPPPKPLARDKVEAGKNVVMLDVAVLQAELAKRMYKRPIEVLAREIHYEPLPQEVRAVIVAAWVRGGMLPRATVEKMVPEKSGA
jgi:hypothetical protein